MGLYGDKKDYEQLVKENIEKANLLYSLSEKDKKEIQLLLKKKSDIIEKNGIMANFQLNTINKKIQKIKNKYKNNV